MTQQPQNALQILDQQFLDRKAEFQAALPSNCTVEKFFRIIKTAAIQTPALLSAERSSLFMAAFKAAQDGLLPDGRESALVIYKIKKDGKDIQNVQYMPMIAGVLKKIRNSGELSTLAAHVVYENDEFDYSLGDDEHIKHKPTMGERGKPICAYARVETKDGAVYREVMSVHDIEKIRMLSSAEKAKIKYPSNKATVWDEHWDEMAKKTVIRRLSKRLPMSSDLETVIQRDDEMFEFDGNTAQAKPYINPIDRINQQVIDIGDAEEVVTDVEPEVSEDVIAKAEEMFKK